MQKHNVDFNQNLESCYCVTKFHPQQSRYENNVKQIKIIMLVMFLAH